MPVIDAHQHLWTLAPGRYDWIPEGHPVLHRTYQQAEIAPQLAAAGVDASILVQAEDSRADTDEMLAVAEAEQSVAGVVGWVPLLDPTECAAQLEELTTSRWFVGVRHLVHDEPDPDWVLQPAVLESLQLLADMRVPFDLVAVLPRHLEHAARLAERIPDLQIVIDHLAKPPVRERGWEPWASLLAAAAEHPNVVAKVSGLNTAAAEDWTAADLEPYVHHALEVFGAGRLLYGGDWPVALLAGDYARVLSATRELLSELSQDEQAQVLGGTAAAVYALPPQNVPGSTG